MAFFKTPLFWAVSIYISLLCVLSSLGFFRKDFIPAPPALEDGAYHLFEARVESRMARGWRLKNFHLDGHPSEASFYFLPAHDLELVPGARLSFWGRYQGPRDAAWSGLFDWKGYLAREGLSGTVYLDRAQDAGIEAPAWKAFTLLHRFHERLLARIREEFRDPRAAGLLSGLVLGDKRLLENSLKRSFIGAGVMHLLVASGLHVALAYGFFFSLCLYALRFSRVWSQFISLTAMWLFAVFIGLNAPVLRAAVMVSALCLPLLSRELPAISRLAAAALAFLLIEPALIEDASFLLSFGSTFGILYGWMLWSGPKNSFISASLTSFFAWAALLPFSAGLFHQISFIAPVSNLVLIPFSSLLLAGTAFYLTASPFLPAMISIALNRGLEWAAVFFVQIADFFSGLPLAYAACAPWGPAALMAWGGLLAWPALRRGPALWGKAALAFFFAGFLWTAGAHFFASPTVEMFFEDGEPVLALASQGTRQAACGARHAAEFERSRILESRGWRPFADACEREANALPDFSKTLPPMPFQDRFSLAFSCRAKTLIFPLTLLGGSGKESVSYNCPL